MSEQPDPIVIAVHDADCGCSSLVHPEPERWDYYARVADAVRARLQLRTEYAWACGRDGCAEQPHYPMEGADPEQWARARAEDFGAVYVREVTDWRPEVPDVR